MMDFKNPEKSMRYNLLQPIIDAINEGDTDRAEMLAWEMCIRDRNIQRPAKPTSPNR